MYTSHGHQIPGTFVEGDPVNRARCGGVGLCGQCMSEAAKQATNWPEATKQATKSTSEHQPHQLIRYFAYDHLSPPLSVVSSAFHRIATWIDLGLPDGSEKTEALRKLLEAKDAAVRAALDLPQQVKDTNGI